jgi:hypothetical protein
VDEYFRSGFGGKGKDGVFVFAEMHLQVLPLELGRSVEFQAARIQL